MKLQGRSQYRVVQMCKSGVHNQIPPEICIKAVVIPLHKKDIKHCENYREMKLLNSGCKVYTNIIKNKLYIY
jgi:hypothetical protein